MSRGCIKNSAKVLTNAPAQTTVNHFYCVNTTTLSTTVGINYRVDIKITWVNNEKIRFSSPCDGEWVWMKIGGWMDR